MGGNGSVFFMAGLLLFLGAGCGTVMTAFQWMKVPLIAQKT
jgi:hypothetical protein